MNERQVCAWSLRVARGIRIVDLLECFEKFTSSLSHHECCVRFVWRRPDGDES